MVSLVEIFLFQSQFRNLEESVAREVLLVQVLGDLFKVQDGILLLRCLILDAFRQDFADVEMCLDVGVVRVDDLLEITQRRLELFFMEASQTSLHMALLKELLVVIPRLLRLQQIDSLRVGCPRLFISLESL